MGLELAPTQETPYSGNRLIRTLAEFRNLGKTDVTFGGPVVRGASGLEITGLHNTNTRSLQDLRVRNGQGLGGKAIDIGRPVSVVNYSNARGITHQYDRQVQMEQLETMTALPILVDRIPRMVIYLAHRAEVFLGDAWYDSFTPLVRKVERDIAIDDEVRRRLKGLSELSTPRIPEGALSRDELSDIADELADLARLVPDDVLRQRLELVRSRVDRGVDRRRPNAAATRIPPTVLAAREIDVLNHVALGQSNREVASALGLVESTVKSYLKNAMRKLHATNRVHAVHLARESGVID